MAELPETAVAQNTVAEGLVYTKAARVLIAFSVITKKKKKRKNALNYSLHVLRMTGFRSASSKCRGITWQGDARFEKRSVEVKISGRQLVLKKRSKDELFHSGYL